ncbi:hypothetical protein, partial [Pseudomonas aeruginosa]|uniref:hypothetical protein n=1 Tax=Pseudomonas aeruginosa TaxID=287 RepID=UPI001C1F394C
MAALVAVGGGRLGDLVRLVADVGVVTGERQTLHLVVDGAGHEVEGGVLSSRGKARDETRDIGQVV